jgi:hypothetical protein
MIEGFEMVNEKDYSFVLFYKKNVDYADKIDATSVLLDRIDEKWGVSYSLVESENLNASTIQKFKSDVRGVLPQVRGKIVSSRGFVLPLSGSKNPNLDNTPVLILYKEGIPVDVFPHLLGTTYFTIEDAVRGVLKYGPREYLESKGLLEDPVVKILSDNPSVLEEGMQFVDINVMTDVGEIDLLLRDSEERMVVVEVETRANDFAVGQVCRLAIGYSEKSEKPPAALRRIIVCVDFDESVKKTCQGADVELYQISLRKLN